VLESLRPSFRLLHLLPDINFIEGRNGHLDEAFALAERYRDFQSLATLCNKDGVYPSTENPHAARVETYIERFGDAFTAELFEWYIEHGLLVS
jgi:nuclear pore complex protein Nup133